MSPYRIYEQVGDSGTSFLNQFNSNPNTYSNLGTQLDCRFRLVWVLDPASVRVNINRDLFPDVKNVTVIANCGIYTNRNVGNTAPYRQFMMLGDRPSFRLGNNGAQQPTGTLANDPATPVYSPDAHQLMGKTMHMLSLIPMP